MPDENNDVTWHQPAGFNEDDHMGKCAIVDSWTIARVGHHVHLVAEFVAGHAQHEDGQCFLMSAQLHWIDKKTGWARTGDGLYKLGKRRPPDECDNDLNQ